MGGLDREGDEHQTAEQERQVPEERTTTTRVGVDIGGTFTDVVFSDDSSGEVRIGKVPTVASALEQGVEAGISSLLSREEVAACEYFLHGTTVGTNAILQRSGPMVGLLATRGFRDILEIRRTDRVDPYELLTAPWVPLVPRRVRLPVTERIRGSGEVHTPIEEDDVRRALAIFETESVEAIAIAFLNSFANPAHELAAEQILREAGFAGEISLSHQVSGEYREYERTTTTVVDCYVRPSMRAYLTLLERGLEEAGFGGESLMVRPDGGAISFGEAKERPFETILSGPVGGVQGTCELARTLELGDVVTRRRGRNELRHRGGKQRQTAAHVRGRGSGYADPDRLGRRPLDRGWRRLDRLRRRGRTPEGGPRGAPAPTPGPPAMGEEGRSPPSPMARSASACCPTSSPRASASTEPEQRRRSPPSAEALALDLAAVARGIVLIASAAMAGKMHEITVEQGRDPRLLTLVAYGGAGPLFATLLARELEIPQVVIPLYPGNFSAWGMLGVDLTRTATRTRVMKLGDPALEMANRLLPELFSASAARANTNGRKRVHEVALDMRYEGQEHTVTVAVPANEDQIELTARELHELFTKQYLETFSYTLEFEPEIVTLRATLREPLPRRKTEALAPASTDAYQSETRSAYSFAHDEWLDFELVMRAELGSETLVAGPAIILEETATSYLDAGFQASVDPCGALFIRPAGAS